MMSAPLATGMLSFRRHTKNPPNSHQEFPFVYVSQLVNWLVHQPNEPANRRNGKMGTRTNALTWKCALLINQSSYTGLVQVKYVFPPVSLDIHLVNVAPTPMLSRFEGSHDRVIRLVKMCGRVLVLR